MGYNLCSRSSVEDILNSYREIANQYKQPLASNSLIIKDLQTLYDAIKASEDQFLNEIGIAGRDNNEKLSNLMIKWEDLRLNNRLIRCLTNGTKENMDLYAIMQRRVQDYTGFNAAQNSNEREAVLELSNEYINNVLTKQIDSGLPIDNLMDSILQINQEQTKAKKPKKIEGVGSLTFSYDQKKRKASVTFSYPTKAAEKEVKSQYDALKAIGFEFNKEDLRNIAKEALLEYLGDISDLDENLITSLYNNMSAKGVALNVGLNAFDKSNFQGFWGEVCVGAMLDYINQNPENRALLAGFITNESGREIPIDVFFNQAGFQVKNIPVNSAGTGTIKYDARTIDTLGTALDLPMPLTEVMKALFAAEHYNTPVRGYNLDKTKDYTDNTWMDIYNEARDVKSVLNPFVSHALKFGSVFGLSDEAKTQGLPDWLTSATDAKEMMFNTFFIVGNRLVSSAMLLQSIIEELQTVNRETMYFQTVYESHGKEQSKSLLTLPDTIESNKGRWGEQLEVAVEERNYSSIDMVLKEFKIQLAIEIYVSVSTILNRAIANSTKA